MPLKRLFRATAPGVLALDEDRLLQCVFSVLDGGSCFICGIWVGLFICVVFLGEEIWDGEEDWGGVSFREVDDMV